METKNLLKSKLALKGMTSAEFAEKLGISHQSLSNKMNQGAGWTTSQIATAIEVLDLTPGETCEIFLTLK